ncbi:hypothetical protein BDY21DRAFT_366475 [Lineolata rhizophorae]|uniref:Uncharacterized protein n=1 Tax=Lineolata rhizophorae TaxID=578093 RepID=A0A6A6NR55_9PEZI|nr:hypothetical protein BDY21DRAFT_366475 [Lineolata rhizophorae]
MWVPTDGRLNAETAPRQPSFMRLCDGSLFFSPSRDAHGGHPSASPNHSTALVSSGGRSGDGETRETTVLGWESCKVLRGSVVGPFETKLDVRGASAFYSDPTTRPASQRGPVYRQFVQRHVLSEQFI